MRELKVMTLGRQLSLVHSSKKSSASFQSPGLLAGADQAAVGDHAPLAPLQRAASARLHNQMCHAAYLLSRQSQLHHALSRSGTRSH